MRDVPAGSQRLDLWLPVPHADKSQVISELKITAPYPYELTSGAYGNQMVHLQVAQPPTTGFTITLTFRAVRREHQNPFFTTGPQSAPAEAADPDRLVPLDPQITA